MNSTALEVTEVYVATASSSTWGANQLSSSIAPGSSRTISNITAGVYDVRAVASDGSQVERYGVQLTEGGAFTWTLVPTSGSLRIVNGYTSPIAEVYVSSASSGTWGPSQLSAPIAVGGSFTLTDIPAGNYDLRAVAADGAYVESYGVSIQAGGIVTWTLTTATLPTGAVTVVNNYAYPIDELYVASSASATWGPNQLSTPIPAGGSRTITNVPAGLIDLRAVASDGLYSERYDVPLAAGETVTWTLSMATVATGSVRVVNNYGYAITELYITPSSWSTWGVNQLSAPIPAGGSFTITGVPAGLIDLAAFTSDGAYVEQYGVALGAGETVTWTLAPAPPAGSVTVVNNYSYPLTELYVTPSTSPTWGANLLSAPIPVGGSITITDVPAGLIDLRVVASNGVYAEDYEVLLGAGENIVWTLSVTASVTVVNGYISPITELYVALSSSPSWGANRLPAPIPVGGSYTVSGLASGTYDFNAVTTGGYWVHYGQYLAPGSVFTWTLVP